MLLSLVALTLLGAPRAPAGADAVTWIPKLDQLSASAPFFAAAGTRSVLLRTEGWRGEAHPLLTVDLFDRESVLLAGLDPAGELTRSSFGDSVVTCVSLGDVTAYRAACDAKLARLGTTATVTVKGVSVATTRDALNRVLAAYAVQGKQSCAMTGHGRSVEPQLGLLAEALTKPAKGGALGLGAALPGAAVAMLDEGAQQGAVAFSSQGLTARLDGRGKGLQLAQLQGAGPSPFGAFSAPGLAVLRGRFSPAQLPALVEQVTRTLPGSAALLPLARQLAPAMTGNVALLASHARVTSGLRTREARFFALRHALLVEVADPALAAAALEKLDPATLAFREGKLSVSLHGAVLVLANDAEVQARALAALPAAAGKQAHGLELVVEPKLLAKALQQVPLLEAVQAPELAGFVAASTELGPLLLASERVSAWLDSGAGGKHTGQLSWALDPSKFTGDAGVPSR
jgi:hypothetical protein